jgi:hypothetical protein
MYKVCNEIMWQMCRVLLVLFSALNIYGVIRIIIDSILWNSFTTQNAWDIFVYLCFTCLAIWISKTQWESSECSKPEKQ